MVGERRKRRERTGGEMGWEMEVSLRGLKGLRDEMDAGGGEWLLPPMTSRGFKRHLGTHSTP